MKIKRTCRLDTEENNRLNHTCPQCNLGNHNTVKISPLHDVICESDIGKYNHTVLALLFCAFYIKHGKII